MHKSSRLSKTSRGSSTSRGSKPAEISRDEVDFHQQHMATLAGSRIRQEVVAHPRLPLMAWADGEIPGAGVIICRMADGVGSFNPFSAFTNMTDERTIEAAACDAGAWGRLLEGNTVTALCWGCCHSLFAATRTGIKMLRLQGSSGHPGRCGVAAHNTIEFPKMSGMLKQYQGFGIWTLKYIKLKQNVIYSYAQKGAKQAEAELQLISGRVERTKPDTIVVHSRPQLAQSFELYDPSPSVIEGWLEAIQASMSAEADHNIRVHKTAEMSKHRGKEEEAAALTGRAPAVPNAVPNAASAMAGQHTEYMVAGELHRFARTLDCEWKCVGELVSEMGVTYTTLASAPLRPTPSHQLCAPEAADSLVLGVTDGGVLRVWAVSAPTCGVSQPSTVELPLGVTPCGRASVVTALPQTTLNCTDPKLPMLAVGYMDGTVDMLVINPPPDGVLDPSHELCSLWTRFLGNEHRAPVTHLAMSSSLRVAIVCDDAPDVVRIFQASSSLHRFEHESDLCAPHVVETASPTSQAAAGVEQITHRVTTVEWLQVPGWRPALSLTCGGVVELFQRCSLEGQHSAHAGATKYERYGIRIGETLSRISGSCWTWGGVCVSAAEGNLYARPAPPMVVQRMDPCSDLPSFHPAVLIELVSMGAAHVASVALAHMVDMHLQCCHQGVADMPDMSLLAELQLPVPQLLEPSGSMAQRKLDLSRLEQVLAAPHPVMLASCGGAEALALFRVFGEALSTASRCYDPRGAMATCFFSMSLHPEACSPYRVLRPDGVVNSLALCWAYHSTVQQDLVEFVNHSPLPPDCPAVKQPCLQRTTSGRSSLRASAAYVSSCSPPPGNPTVVSPGAGLMDGLEDLSLSPAGSSSPRSPMGSSLGSPTSLRMREMRASSSWDLFSESSPNSPRNAPSTPASTRHKQASELRDVSEDFDGDSTVQYQNTCCEWERHRVMGVPLWVKGYAALKKTTEGLCTQLTQRIKGGGSAKLVQDLTALLYCALGKVNVLKAVYKSIIKDAKIAEFLSADFNDPTQQSKASKNAFKLLSMHRYHLAAAFFIIGKQPTHALGICAKQLNDMVLGFLLARLLHTAEVPLLGQYINEYMIPGCERTADNCLLSLMRCWQHPSFELDGFANCHSSLDEASESVLSSLLVKPENQKLIPPSLSCYSPAALHLYNTIAPQNLTRCWQSAGNVIKQDSPAAIGACGTVNRYLAAGSPSVALVVAAGAVSRMSGGVRRTVMEQCVVQCVARLTIAAKNGGSAMINDCDALGLIQEVQASLPSELEHDHTHEILAMLADSARCRRQLQSRCVASAAATDPTAMIQILWNECRQPLVALYRYGRGAVVGDQDTLSKWRPCAYAWVSRLLEHMAGCVVPPADRVLQVLQVEQVLNGSVAFKQFGEGAEAEGAATSDGSVTWTQAQSHIRAHTICVVMATALCYHNYALIQRTLQLERESLQTADLCSLLKDILESDQLDDPLDAYNTTPCSLPYNMTRTNSDLLSDTASYSEEEQLFAVLGVLVCAALRKLLLRVLDELACAQSLKTLQVLGCVDAWGSGFERIVQSGNSRAAARSAQPSINKMDRLEAACLSPDGLLHCGDSASLWLWLRQLPDLSKEIVYEKYSGWVQMKAGWSTGARFLVLERNSLGVFTVGEELANYSDSTAWSPNLKHYTATDGGEEEGLYKVDVNPQGHKEAFLSYSFFCNSVEERQQWLKKLQRHCLDATKAAAAQKTRDRIKALGGK